MDCASYYWLRSPRNNTNNAAQVNMSSGNVNNNNVNNSYGVRPDFLLPLPIMSVKV
ncbi:MAG: DUF6273 domain-containing protein [Oscillospiraceae bacterium]|nr:DUF6273 domain-containing protein [Oscillospiraceae bacterium]